MTDRGSTAKGDRSMSDIKKKCATVQTRPGGWFKVPGVADPVAELLEEVERLEGELAAKKAKPAKKRGRVSAAVDTRTPED
jgi:hypothetical protein